MEKEIKPGIFISVVTQEQWIERTGNLTGEDLRFFVCQCNPFKLNMGSLRNEGIKPHELQQFCEDLNEDFDPETDYFTIRYTKSHEQR